MTPAADMFTSRDLEVMSEAKNYASWIFSELIAPNLGRRILEIGSGIGTYSAMIARSDRVTELTCVEVDPSCVTKTTETLQPFTELKKIRCIEGDYVAVDLERDRFDTIVCVNVLEHLRDDDAALSKARAALAPGGRLILYVPAFPALHGPIDQRLGHFRRYTKSVLRSAIERAGLRVENVRYYNVAGFFGWIVRFRWLRQERQSITQVQIFDRWMFPFQTRVESRLPWLPFGQSLYAVAVKDGAPTASQAPGR